MITCYRVALFLLSCLAIAQGQRISKRKCSEYREQTILRAQFIYLQPNPEPIVLELFNCSKTVKLIVGGEEAKPGEFPHQAVLGWKSKTDPSKFDFRCGGSLISERYVLTAAHCFEPGPPDVVRLGELNLKNDNDNQEDYEVEEYIRHPQHRFFQSYNDIALIKLAEDVPFHLFVRPACLWDSYDMNVTEVIATGYGLTEDFEQSDKLLKVQLDFLPRKECVAQYAKQRKFKQGIIEEQLCIGSVREGRDTCQGDSGGPIQVITEPEGCMFHVLGLTSAGSACGIGRSPSIYTRVAGYIDWIESIVWK
ncbi:serine protease snake-like [Ochlerotatus camptorhynchus]|uniref:serine protease snake-like n=1 Tax=Ochlerotatus camptorhynchus TaxID=644619 RepID=UPI0031D5C3EC